VSGPPEDEERTEDEHDRCHRARHPLAHRENVVRAAPRAATPGSAEGERDLKPRDENESGRSAPAARRATRGADVDVSVVPSSLCEARNERAHQPNGPVVGT
jgi:hypothetical protein